MGAIIILYCFAVVEHVDAFDSCTQPTPYQITRSPRQSALGDGSNASISNSDSVGSLDSAPVSTSGPSSDCDADEENYSPRYVRRRKCTRERRVAVAPADPASPDPV